MNRTTYGLDIAKNVMQLHWVETETGEILAQAKEDLRREGKAFDPWMPIGMMVEVPAAVWMADRLVKEREGQRKLFEEGKR